MALPSSGLITLANLQTEFGGSNPISLSEYYRGGAYVPNSSYTATIPTSGAITLQNFHGTSNVFTATISTNTADLNVSTWLDGLGWNGLSAVRITVNTGIYVYSTTTARGALYNSPNITSCTLVNNGFIMGKGGNGNGGAGGDALTLAGNLTLINNSSGYIGGGGGAGTRGADGNYSGGGGGAGGGTGGVGNGVSGGAGGTIGNSGADGQISGAGVGGGNGGTAGGSGGDFKAPLLANGVRGGGGGGGRILPGSLTPGPDVGGGYYTPGTYGGGPGQAGQSKNSGGVGSGGGGWGAAGGNTYTTGGAAGKAVDLNGFSCTISGTTSQIYGAVA